MICILRTLDGAYRGALKLATSLTLAVVVSGGAARAGEAMDFQEVYQLLKANLAGATDSVLNDAAVKGLLAELGPRASLVEDVATEASTNAVRAAVTTELFDKHFAYVRVHRLAAGAADEMATQYTRLRATNTLKGLVLDLRYASGQDYTAAVAFADRFVAGETALVDWGEGWKKSSAKTNAITLPVAVLVNRKTSGAAEALAGMLRHREVGLLIGTNTAGQASMAKIFTLKTGQRLRVAVAPLKVADGRELPLAGIKPDIEVTVSPEDELAYYADAFKILVSNARSLTVTTNVTLASGTNRAPRRRMNEAELVRMSREGIEHDVIAANPTPAVPEPVVPVITDPVLARALDLLKGLAVVQQFRSI